MSTSDYPPSPLNWIDRLPDPERRIINAAFKTRMMHGGGELYTPLSPERGVYRLVSGAARTYVISPNGRQILFRILRPGEIFGQVVVFDAQPYPVFINCQSGAQIGFIPSAEFAMLCAGHPEISRLAVESVARYYRLALRMLVSALLGDAREKVIDRLMLLSEFAEDYGAFPLELHLTQEDLGEMLGLSRQTVSTIVHDLQKEGAIVISYRAISIQRPLNAAN